MSLTSEFTKGFIRENPVFILTLGLCPTLAVTTGVKNGVGMGLATLFVLLCSNILVSMLKKIIPAQIRIPCFIVVIATFVTVVDLSMKAFFPELHKELGLFIPLIVVNCIILGRAEAFASKNGVIASMADALGMGLGFTFALVILGSIREILGSGSFFGMPLFSESFQPAIMMILPPGAFLTLGMVLAAIQWKTSR
ncbi:MAG: electron transport complex subunit RsxE [Candidatus Wallbacteria bacterium HGW-Wallbacteria-1]|jgi:electron transport complex protein RnfE|uniref:Ion-translocating oxidoreductase complex subunit E n=1 Tax=Candidatus Wallbacteria bacterium HGW-Wallbacteria-1 TaxID=2013854 RepID=A0A2N1PV57_9BACT|nr:MAG: electron transport complex subunit RsxE [Candidatus Wallbacteria bacterium HGW-Wallbacteria-1]